MPLITLTSDIGSPDYLVGALKAQLLQLNPDFQIIDISHNIPPFNYPQAAYVCRSAIKNFPEFSYHLILVNLFEKKPEQLLLAFHDNQYLLCADNGLLTMILEENPEMVMGIPLPAGTVNTIQLAAVMGNTVNQLVNGESIKNIGNAEVKYLEKRHLRPTLDNNVIESQIIFIDSFENVIVNITREQFEEQRQGRKFRIAFKRDEIIDRISETYADVLEGEKLALFNSAGYLEIAINKGNAAGLFGLKGFSEKMRESQLSYQTVKIYFDPA
jgi:S-adenosylmethionine hydrolase